MYVQYVCVLLYVHIHTGMYVCMNINECMRVFFTCMCVPYVAHMYHMTCTCHVCHVHTYIHDMYLSTVGFRWSWAWNDERGEWEFEKLNKITQYRHNINTSIKKRVIVSFYNVSCSLSDTWLAKKRKNIFFTRPTILFLIFDLTFLWFFDFFVQLWFPCGTCGGKPLPVFQFPSK